MNCKYQPATLDAYCDGELEPSLQREIEAHVRSCASCTAAVAAARERKTALKAALGRYRAPAELVARLRAETAAPASAAARVVEFRRQLWPALGMAACLALGLFAGAHWAGRRAAADSLLDEAVNNHVRSLQAAHLTDVASTDRHTVKPWFAGRLDFSPPVVDLASEGFPLIGGRLERVSGHTAAALVFHRRQHTINLLVWPAGDDALPPETAERNGYHTLRWTQGGLALLAVSEIPADELMRFRDEFIAASAGN